MDSIVAATGELFGPVWGLILALAAGLGGAAVWLQGGALQAPGPDRDRLLRSLEIGGDLRRLYVFWLTRGLNRVDRFLGDAGKAAFSLPSPFGNRERAPYWTGWSFETCALITLAYPLLGVFAAWVWTGDAGLAGRGLGLSAATPPSGRLAVVAGLTVAGLAIRQGARNHRRFGDGWRATSWFAVAAAIGATNAVAGVRSVAGIIYIAIVGVIVGDGVISIAVSMAAGVLVGAVLVVIGVVVGGFDDVVGFVISAVLSAIIISVFGADYLVPRMMRNDQHGRFWLLAWPFVIGFCYLLLTSCITLTSQRLPLLLIVMVGLVPLVNIPFDWASIGVTRALLRRGCEPDAPSPFLLGVVDFGFGLLLLGLLAVALLTALLAADHVTARAGVAPLIDLPRLFHRLATTPGSTANWWVYLTLFSTMLPSVLNCLIGAVSLISWSLPSLRRWMLEVIPTLDQPGLDRTRSLVLLAFGGQVFFGTLLTGGALLGLVRGAEAIAPFALSDLLIGAEAWVRARSATGHV